jgi:hypothetical protein
MTLGDAFAVFRGHPTGWIISAALLITVAVRVILGGWDLEDVVAMAIVVAALPFVEWFTHVVLLHWKPKKVFGRRFDPVVAREHRKHHLDPRDVKLIFIPLPFLVGVVVVSAVLYPLLATTPRHGLSAMIMSYALLLMYEWTHYLIHSRYRPKTRMYRYVWRAHRLHHFRNENYWFGVTVHLADHLFRTFPEKNAVPVSETARTLGVA